MNLTSHQVDVVVGVQNTQVPYFNHAGQYTQKATIPDAILFLSLGNSNIRSELEKVLANQAKIMAHLGIEG